MSNEIKHGPFTVRVEDSGLFRLSVGSSRAGLLLAVEDLSALSMIAFMAEKEFKAMRLMPAGVAESDTGH